jgi:hypothetical protein
MVGCGLALLGLGLLVSGKWARQTAQRTAALLMPAHASLARDAEQRPEETVRFAGAMDAEQQPEQTTQSLSVQ